MVPSDELAVRIKAGADPVVVVGPVHVVLDVLLAAPHDLHRIFRLLGDERRLHDEVELEPAAEAAAEQMIVEAHLLRLQSERLGDGHLRDGRDLRADPDIAAVGRHVHRAVDRLHGGVREERALIDRFDLGGGAGQRGVRVALVLGDGSRLLGRLGQGGNDVGRGERGVRPVVELWIAPASRPFFAAQ